MQLLLAVVARGMNQAVFGEVPVLYGAAAGEGASSGRGRVHQGTENGEAERKQLARNHLVKLRGSHRTKGCEMTKWQREETAVTERVRGCRQEEDRGCTSENTPKQPGGT